MRSLFHVLVMGIVASVAGVGIAQATRASGGANIASAPTVAIGHQEFGSTSDGCFQNCEPADYWKLPLIAADKVTIDWESPAASNGGTYADRFDVWPVGTTDFSINNTQVLEDFIIGSNDKEESTFVANKTGVYPLMIRDCCSGGQAGPYDFTVYVVHSLVLGVSPQTRTLLATAHHTPLPHAGRIVLYAHTADGAPVSHGLGGTLFGYWGAKWRKLGVTTVKAGQLAIAYRLPASVHGAIRLAVNVGGENYEGKRIAWGGIKA